MNWILLIIVFLAGVFIGIMMMTMLIIEGREGNEINDDFT